MPDIKDWPRWALVAAVTGLAALVALGIGAMGTFAGSELLDLRRTVDNHTTEIAIMKSERDALTKSIAKIEQNSEAARVGIEQLNRDVAVLKARSQ